MATLETFTIKNKDLPVLFLNADQVKEGVECDVYSFVGDTSKDLAIVRVQPEFKTPLQKVVDGERTVEGYISGEGRLMIRSVNDEVTYYDFAPGNANNPVEVKVGEYMQWQATGGSELSFYELCTPPYKKGRFEDQD